MRLLIGGGRSGLATMSDAIAYSLARERATAIALREVYCDVPSEG
jgi:hypothetical protein